VLLDREIHWMYNKGRLQPWRGQRQLPGARGQRLAHLCRALPGAGRSRRPSASWPSSFPPSARRASRRPRWSRRCMPPSACPRGSTPRGRRPSRRGRTAFWPATGPRPAGPRRWRARRARATWPRRPCCRAMGEAAGLPRSRPAAAGTDAAVTQRPIFRPWTPKTPISHSRPPSATLEPTAESKETGQGPRPTKCLLKAIDGPRPSRPSPRASFPNWRRSYATRSSPSRRPTAAMWGRTSASST
jgi:hypothetical protein